jgi:hypothetical protein
VIRCPSEYIENRERFHTKDSPLDLIQIQDRMVNNFHPMFIEVDKGKIDF